MWNFQRKFPNETVIGPLYNIVWNNKKWTLYISVAFSVIRWILNVSRYMLFVSITIFCHEWFVFTTVHILLQIKVKMHKLNTLFLISFAFRIFSSILLNLLWSKKSKRKIFSCHLLIVFRQNRKTLFGWIFTLHYFAQMYASQK